MNTDELAGQGFVAFEIASFADTRRQLLYWASQYSNCCFLDHAGYPLPAFGSAECLVAAGTLQQFECTGPEAIDGLKLFLQQHQQQWVFGHLGYGLGAHLMGLPTQAPQAAGFTDTCFFIPDHLIVLGKELLWVKSHSLTPQQIWEQIKREPAIAPSQASTQLQPRLHQQAYLATLEQLRQHIARGDCYELNFCLEFAGHLMEACATQWFEKLSTLSPNPFSCFYRQNHSYLCCASPERYIKRQGSTLISQPIKGTAARQVNNPLHDEASRLTLLQSAKDRSENVMVVDLVRNDLSQVCMPGSVRVKELFGVYTYPQVFQMISTIEGQLKPEVDFVDIIKASFPMGSMTGAPKKRVMELISLYEPGPRGLFSGSVGYITPQGNFDFNVVIRSLLYNGQTGHLSLFAGSGITWYSQPQQEYEECLLKAKAMMQVLEG